MGRSLVTLEEFYAYKKITKPDDDTKMTLILEGINNFVKEFCKRSFIDYYDTNKIELKDASSEGIVFLDEFPLVSITSVELSIDGGENFNTLDEFTNYYVNYDNSSITSGDVDYPLALGAVPNVPNLRITYKAGYETTPTDLRLAIMDLAEYYKEEEYTPRKAFKDMSIENLGFRENSNASLPSHIKRIFEMYRRLE